MLQRVALQEVILATIAAELELRPHAERGARVTSFPNRLLGAGQVAVEVHGPLVQAARRQLHHPHRTGFVERNSTETRNDRKP